MEYIIFNDMADLKVAIMQLHTNKGTWVRKKLLYVPSLNRKLNVTCQSIMKSYTNYYIKVETSMVVIILHTQFKYTNHPNKKCNYILNILEFTIKKRQFEVVNCKDVKNRNRL